jgi:hypothetical protein
MILICYLPQISSSFDNEPDGFRGIKWETSITELQDMVHVASMGDSKCYWRKDDKKAIGQADVNHIVYFFYKDKFSSVLIQYSDNTNFYHIKDALQAVYGAGYQPNKYMHRFFWNGTITEILNDYSEITQKGKIVFFCSKLKRIQEENKKSAAQELKSNF